MSKATKSSRKKRCNCINQVNAQLKEYNTELDCVPTINFATNKFDTGLFVAVRKVDPKIRKRMKTILATYCPFCGKVL